MSFPSPTCRTTDFSKVRTSCLKVKEYRMMLFSKPFYQVHFYTQCPNYFKFKIADLKYLRSDTVSLILSLPFSYVGKGGF